ncbi:hypothetical protein BM525_19495 (plasmid) [Alteromonas mediterranea]|uniref:Uncharacterized protein n=1 Tax=Alteromonas mediterranea TaxID=314275 RepID=A0AAC9JDQ4_9ALTE|nr:hypothetical protein [Alteromonas mediterranea]APD92069.1 hypothetical protein BM524_19300 [Alteromonas mediterranea]APD99923.1 hypothetical protein BM525_19495 [Alteromonas mediterranea]
MDNSITAVHIQEQINELDGAMGTNCANAALNILKEAFEDGVRLDLDDKNNQLEFLTDLDDMIVELLGFRQRLGAALQTGSLMDAECDTASIRQLVTSSSLSVDKNKGNHKHAWLPDQYNK